MLIRLFLALLLTLILSNCSEPETSKPLEGQTEMTQTATAQAETADSADIILHNARVYTLNWPDPDVNGKPHPEAPFTDGQWQPDATVVAVSGGKIVAVGGEELIAKYQSEETEVIDLKGATLLPGFIDSHTHLLELGKLLHVVDLTNVESPEQAIERIKDFAVNIPEGDWIIGRGWDGGAWANQYPDKAMLDAVFPNNPVYLQSLHGFAVWANSLALVKAGIDKDSEPPVGGEIRRDDSGEPTGIMLNRATTLFAEVLPKPDQNTYAVWLHDAMKQLNKDGFVGAHEAGVDRLMLRALEQLQQEQRLAVRTYAMISARDGDIVKERLATGPTADPAGFLDIVSVKAYYDGALGSRGARLLEDYSDMEGHRGLSGANYGFNQDRVDALIDAGFQIGIHAIGDAGNRETLAYFAKHMKNDPNVRDRRHRVEHAQVVHPDDFAMFNQLGLIASMEPPHAVEDMKWAESRLGPERVKGAYAWRTFRQNNVPIAFNSDLPGSSHSIFYGLHAAVTRRNLAEQPMGGWYPEQSVSIEEAIRGYTIWSAYAGFREQDTGTISDGKWADLTVLDIDPFILGTTEPEAILAGNVLLTMVNGEIVYRR